MQPQIGTRAFVADVVFLDGSKRRIDYDVAAFSDHAVIFYWNNAQDGTAINLAAVQTVDMTKVVQPATEVRQ